ncbi:MAG: CCDC90 family protein [Magnetococcus sp. YQC-3]
MSTATFAIPFDTLAFAKELETAGVPPAQAEAQAKALSGVLQKVEEYRLQELATKGDVETAKLELQKEIESVRREIEVAKNETIKWMIGLALAQLAMMAGILMTLVRVLPGGH